MSEISREAMEYDIVVVGAGPSGLSAAIRLKQLNSDLNVVILEKGSEVGAHILSGAVLDPSALNKLIPDWKDKGAPLNTAVTEDNFYLMGESGQLRLPNLIMPPLMNNHGNFIVSMGNVCRWMAELRVALQPAQLCLDRVDFLPQLPSHQPHQHPPRSYELSRARKRNLLDLPLNRALLAEATTGRRSRTNLSKGY